MIVLVVASMLAQPTPTPRGSAEAEPLINITVLPDPDPDFVPPPLEPSVVAANPRLGRQGRLRADRQMKELEREALASIRKAEEAVARTCATVLAAERAAGESSTHPTCNR